MAADIAIFDPESIIDRATMDDGRRYTMGVDFVIINGQVVLDQQGPTGSLPGSRLKAGVAVLSDSWSSSWIRSLENKGSGKIEGCR